MSKLASVKPLPEVCASAENNTAETTCNFIYNSVADELRMRLRLWHTAHHPLPRPAARAHAVIARARAHSRRAGPPPPPKRAPTQGTFGEHELTPEEMQSLCAQYTKTYDGQIPPMWKAAFDGNLPAMKALHFFYRKGVDGFDAMNREDRSMPTHIACLRGHHAVLEWLAGLHWHDGRLVTNFNLRDDGGHTPLWLCAAWGWEKCVRLLLTLPHVHPLVPDAQGVSPEEAARRVGFHQVRRPASPRGLLLRSRAPSSRVPAPSSSRLDGVVAVVTHPRTQIADAIKVRAEELGVALPERAFWDEPDKRFYVKEPEAAPAAEESDDEEDME